MFEDVEVADFTRDNFDPAFALDGNTAPIANPDADSTDENTSLTVDVLDNDTDVDGDDSPANFSLDSVSIASTSGLLVSPEEAGSVSVVNNQLVFDPGTNFDELDASDTATVLVNYTMSDDSGEPSSSTVSLTVNGINDAPVLDTTGTPALATINEDVSDAANTGTLVSALVGASITDVDDSALQGIAVTSLETLNGTWQYKLASGGGWTNAPALSANTALLLGADDSLRFVPNADYNGSASLVYQAWDQTFGTAGSTADASINGETTAFSTASETATIKIDPVNDAPVANSDSGSTDENAPVTIDVLANDTDVDGDDGPAYFSLDSVVIASTLGLSVSPLAAGSVSIVNNKLVFDPGTDFDELNAGDTATLFVDYTMSDDSGEPSSSTATITVNGINDQAVITGGDMTGTVKEDTILAVSGVLSIYDVDLDEAYFEAGQYSGSFGNLDLTATGEWTYTVMAGDLAVQALDDGQSLIDTIDIESVDDTLFDEADAITITIEGTDEPKGNNNGEVVDGTTGHDTIDTTTGG